MQFQGNVLNVSSKNTLNQEEPSSSLLISNFDNNFSLFSKISILHPSCNYFVYLLFHLQRINYYLIYFISMKESSFNTCTVNLWWCTFYATFLFPIRWWLRFYNMNSFLPCHLITKSEYLNELIILLSCCDSVKSEVNQKCIPYKKNPH